LFIDIVVLALGVRHLDAVRHKTKAYSLRESILKPVLMLQESGAPGWDFKYDVPPADEFVFIACGDLPAGIVSSSLRPGALVARVRGPLWDPWWFLIQESVSFPLWFAVGAYLDSTRRRLTKTVQWFFAMRCAFAVLFIVVPGAARLGSVAEGLFWVVVGIYAIVHGMGWIYRHLLRRGQLP
jgi:hypothetical protein